MGLVDADGDQPRWFGTPDVRPPTSARSCGAGAADSALRVGVSGDVLASDGRLSLTGGDHLFRVGLGAQYAPSRRTHLSR